MSKPRLERKSNTTNSHSQLDSNAKICENSQIHESIHSCENASDNDLSRTKMFKKFTINEIVFLAILSAVLTLANAVMPLVAELTKIIFGIAQLVTALQLSFLVTIGLMRVRKPFTTAIILLLTGLIMLMMSPVMFVSNIFTIIVTEIIILLVFKGYASNKACFVAGVIIPPLGLIVPTIYNYITVPEVFALTTSNPMIVIGMVLAIIVVALLGSLLAIKVGSELIKSGVLKNG